MRLWLFIGILWAGMIYTFLVVPERAYAVIHPLHVGANIAAVAAICFAVLVVVGLFDLLKFAVYLGLFALALALLWPLGRLIVFSHPFGPVFGLAFIGIILIRGLVRHVD